MKDFLKKYISYIIIGLILILIILLNIDLKYLIIGLDNASPYFNPINIIPRIKGISSIIYGGIVFQIPFLQILKLLRFSPEAISNIYMFTNLITGGIGITLLLRREVKDNISVILGFLVFITSLFTFWIFGHPNFLFISAFGSVPILIYLLSEKKLNLFKIILLTIFSISFLTSSLNLVAFFLYSLQIFILSIILRKDSLKRSILWIISSLLFWFLTLQILCLINGDNTFLFINILEYIKSLKSNPYVSEITTGIIQSEKTNSFINTFRYSLGWMELHDTKNNPIFSFYDLYRNNILFGIIGSIPYILALFTVFLKKKSKYILLTLCLIIFTLVSSKYGITIIEKIPYIRDSLRWASSKLWIFYIVPLVILFAVFVKNISKKKLFIKIFVTILISITLFIYGAPILNGNLISNKTKVLIPQEYSLIQKKSKILILPHAQNMYMREYDWGYYGSDFISYISDSEIIDGTNLYEYGELYEDIFEKMKIPEDIDYVIYDKSGELNLEKDLIEKSREIVNGLKLINSNEYFDTYER